MSPLLDCVTYHRKAVHLSKPPTPNHQRHLVTAYPPQHHRSRRRNRVNAGRDLDPTNCRAHDLIKGEINADDQATSRRNHHDNGDDNDLVRSRFWDEFIRGSSEIYISCCLYHHHHHHHRRAPARCRSERGRQNDVKCCCV